MTWFTTVCMILALSFITNIFLIWYSIRLLRELLDVSGTLEDLFMDIERFAKHLQSVYELEMFYGDQTLENLLSHARALTKEFDQYGVLFSLKESPERESPEEEENFDDYTDKTQTQ